ncbi:MAG: RNA polymerase sigma factor FliA [Candidatus Muproteobacteria bacterium RBG_16_65_34]|uniref:RNA polymerase sigma factor FliA n=1 Tax=Candidatus Muproteobacteria bacterium RBG_16_65_34 TaxID=1817760 RepID=A0A1F6TSI4_9PROT|nr:MAG: RNA polymerase sigma factor FliA [Candidatus Muproteobacteria bacterium RBG_16_65_34]
MGLTGATLYAGKLRRDDLGDLAVRYAWLVKRIAHHLAGRIPPSVLVGDLIQVGMIGLLDAASHYDAAQGASFETYAGIRIRGAMLDEVRRFAWAPRSVHRKAREVAQAVNRVEMSKGAEARDHEVAQALGVSLDEYHGILQDISGHKMLSFEEMGCDEMAITRELQDRDVDPSARMQAREARRAVAEAIEGLPERERLVLALYYDEELNLKEIGEVLGVSESRVCQIHGQALIRLRARLASVDGENEGAGLRRQRKPD